MANDPRTPLEFFFKLLIRCPTDRLQRLIHHLVDQYCDQKVVFYESFSDIWTLFEWWDLIRGSKCFFVQYYSSNEEVPELSSLPQEFKNALKDSLSIRKFDLRNKLIEKTHEISPTYLHNFDWKLKLTLSSDKMSQINEPHLLLTLNTSGVSDKSLCLDLSKEELKMIIETMEKANKALQDFIIND
ncbi:COMM domain-containing protein 8 [Caerostris extrusa]|uniref:COMM domain-containing protein 8 n=1 Tax=Caerostris extrusa TaxID=172846 RepID=A0AAV4NSM2_CAEEX|nr:COMM domain-containing protein 8 [Caerostris extrusa]